MDKEEFKRFIKANKFTPAELKQIAYEMERDAKFRSHLMGLTVEQAENLIEQLKEADDVSVDGSNRR